MTSRIAISFAMLFLGITPVCFAQVQEVREEINGGLRPTYSASPQQIDKALTKSIPTKDFQEAKRFIEFARKLPVLVAEKGKRFAIEIDDDAFKAENQKPADIRDEEITLPPFPEKLLAHMALRLAVAQVGRGAATYIVRKDEILITSVQRAWSRHFIDHSLVGGEFKNRPLADVLDAFAEQTGVSIIIDQRVAAKARANVTTSFQGKLLPAVRLLTDASGLAPVVVHNVIYVTSADNARRLNARVDADSPNASMVGVRAYKNHPLLSVLLDGGTGYILDERVKRKADIRVTVKWLNHVAQLTQLMLLTDMAGLGYVIMDDIAYITSPENAKKLAEEEAHKKPKR